MQCQYCCSELLCSLYNKEFLKTTVLFNFFYGKVKIKSNVSHWLVIIMMGDLECPIWNLESKLKESCALKSLLKITIVTITAINSFFTAIMTLLTYLNPFQSFIASVLKFGLHSPKNHHLLATTLLWNNKHTRIDDKPRFRKKSLMAGISRIKDIFLTNGKLKPWNFFRKKP